MISNVAAWAVQLVVLVREEQTIGLGALMATDARSNRVRRALSAHCQCTRHGCFAVRSGAVRLILACSRSKGIAFQLIGNAL